LSKIGLDLKCLSENQNLISGVVKKSNFTLTVLLILAYLFSFSQIGYYVTDINNVTGAYRVLGPPITGVVDFNIDDRTIDEKGGTFIFPTLSDCGRIWLLQFF